MKTIKELEEEKEAMRNNTGKPISVIDLGRLEALKDVLKLIDERIDVCKNIDDVTRLGVMTNFNILKQKIQGK